MRGKIVITDAASMLEAATATLDAASATYEVLPDGLPAGEVATRSADADVLIVTYVPFVKSTLQRLRRVGLMIRCGVGVDRIDVAAASEQGIWVANVPDFAVSEVADHALMLLLAAGRHMQHYQRGWPAQGWGSVEHPSVRRLKGRRLGIIGLGRIGSQVALRARAMGMEVVAYSRHLTPARAGGLGVRAVSLDELLRTSDAISLHTPLTSETAHLLDRARFERMKPGVILVNTARGGLIDIDALEWALEQGIVSAVAADVLEGEPAINHSRPLLRRANVTVTPHVAWYSEEAVHELGVLAAEEALRYLRGEMPRAVLNPQARVRYDPS